MGRGYIAGNAEPIRFISSRFYPERENPRSRSGPADLMLFLQKHFSHPSLNDILATR